LEGAARFEGRASLRTWFFSVVRRTAWEHRRRQWVRELLLGRWFTRQGEVTPNPPPDQELRRSEERQALRRTLAKLPARQCEILHLVFYQEMTIEEAAKVLNVSLGTARTHFERGKARLRSLLAAEETR
ncbi:MAG TPA: RNA polymerase sigma factor, partial [Candidatus Acidoferrum sp.]|nr:RNA polymerase sigma factor [Candidatus Acidoferrum sp.]